MLMRPDGSKFWPTFNHLAAIDSVGQFQLIQTSRTELVLNIVARDGILHDDVRAALVKDLKAEYTVTIERRAMIPRQIGGKFEEVIGLIEEKS